MKFGVFTENGSLNSLPVFNSVINGLLKQGHEVVQNSMDVDVPVIWSLLWHGRMAPNKTIWETFHSQNKKVLVTGASRGIGLAIAKGFLNERSVTCIVSRGSKSLFDNEQVLQEEYSSKNIFARN